MPYISPSSGVYIVKGAARAAIYDTNSGNVFSINTDAVEVIETLATSIAEDYSEFADQIVASNLYQWVDQPIDISMLYPPVLPEQKPDTLLRFFWAEITGRCNLRCVHCYAESGEQTFPEELPTEKWKKIITEGYHSGARSMQFIGGEPLVRKDLKELVEFASQIGYQEIEIFTNGTLVSLEFLDWAKTVSGIRFAISFYSDNPEVHDTVTKIAGSWEKTYSTIENIKSFGIPLRVAMIVMRQNENTVESTFSFCKENNIPCKTPDVVRPTGRGASSIIPTRPEILSIRMRTEPDFHTSHSSFSKARTKNTCWANKIAITPNGEVLPCIFARNVNLGSVEKNSLSQILAGQTSQQMWHLTRDNINTCQACEYRYACKDCRPLATSLFVKEKNCTYDPILGVWNNE